jgi:hypothetical protein
VLALEPAVASVLGREDKFSKAVQHLFDDIETLVLSPEKRG